MKRRLMDVSKRAEDPNALAGMDALERARIAESLTDRERAMSVFWSAGVSMVLNDFPSKEGVAMAIEALTSAALALVSEEELTHILDAAEAAVVTLGRSG